MRNSRNHNAELDEPLTYSMHNVFIWGLRRSMRAGNSISNVVNAHNSSNVRTANAVPFTNTRAVACASSSECCCGDRSRLRANPSARSTEADGSRGGDVETGVNPRVARGDHVGLRQVGERASGEEGGERGCVAGTGAPVTRIIIPSTGNGPFVDSAKSHSKAGGGECAPCESSGPPITKHAALLLDLIRASVVEPRSRTVTKPRRKCTGTPRTSAPFAAHHAQVRLRVSASASLAFSTVCVVFKVLAQIFVHIDGVLMFVCGSAIVNAHTVNGDCTTAIASTSSVGRSDNFVVRRAIVSIFPVVRLRVRVTLS